jgi:hypothetical protein
MGKGVFVWDKGWDVVVGIMLGISRTLSTRPGTGVSLGDNVALDFKYDVNSFQFELP